MSGLRPPTGDRGPVDLGEPEPHAGGRGHLGQGADLVGHDARAARRPMNPAAAVDDEVALEAVVDRVVERGPQRGVDHQEQRHDAEPDHQRRGGGGGALGVAGRVLLGEAADDAPQRGGAGCRGPATPAGPRAAPPRSGRGTRTACRRPPPAAATGRRPPGRRCRRPAAPPRARRAGARAPARPIERSLVSMATSRMAATGGTRDARAAGKNADTTVTTVPTPSATTSERGGTHGRHRPRHERPRQRPRPASTPST